MAQVEYYSVPIPNPVDVAGNANVRHLLKTKLTQEQKVADAKRMAREEAELQRLLAIERAKHKEQVRLEIQARKEVCARASIRASKPHATP